MKGAGRTADLGARSGGGDARVYLDEMAAIRKQIDALDRDISHLLAVRLSHACRLAYVKARLGVSIVDNSREADVLRNVEKSCGNPRYAEPVKRIYEAIMAQSKCLQGVSQSSWGGLKSPVIADRVARLRHDRHADWIHWSGLHSLWGGITAFIRYIRHLPTGNVSCSPR